MKQIRHALDELLQKDMDRREFLQHIGAGILTVVGVAGLINALTDTSKHQTKSTGGYGMSSYGGHSRSKRL